MEQNIIKMAKSMKKEFIEITPNYIIGTDVNRCTLSIIYEGSSEYFVGTLQELENKKIPDYWIPKDIVSKELNDIKNRTLPILNTAPLFSIDDLKSSESFMSILDSKMTDGANMCRLTPEYMMYMYSSLHPVNKTDKISCTVFPYDDISFISYFIINKKKYQIHEFIRYLYL